MSPTAGTNVVDVYINYLRRKLHDDPAPPDGGADGYFGNAGPSPLIQTVRGVGYTIGQRA
jgi:DNA-binding response OmpR family regulator